MFILSTDLSTGIYPEIKNLLARYSETVILTCCKIAERDIESHLSRRYLIRPELEKVDQVRDPLLLMVGCDIAIYHLYGRAETIPAKVEKRYDDAIRVLESYASGETVLPGVPSAPNPQEGTPDSSQIASSGRPPRASLV